MPRPPREAPTISAGRPKKLVATVETPGSWLLNAATNMAGSQEGLNSKCMDPCGNTVAEPSVMLTMVKVAPFSRKKPAWNEPWRRKKALETLYGSTAWMPLGLQWLQSWSQLHVGECVEGWCHTALCTLKEKEFVCSWVLILLNENPSTWEVKEHTLRSWPHHCQLLLGSWQHLQQQSFLLFPLTRLHHPKSWRPSPLVSKLADVAAGFLGLQM